MFYEHTEVAVQDLIPYAMNARTHNDAQVAQLAASITEFGFTNPLLVDEGNNLIAGHGRLLAARKLGLNTVPAIVVTDLSPERKRALILADNKLALNAGWDDQVLAAELSDLAADYGELMGFTGDELAKLLKPDVVEGLTDEDATPHLPEEPQSVLGTVWECGNHRVVCGDSTSTTVYESIIDGPADLVFTDPPYGMSYGGGRSAGDSKKGDRVKAHGMIKNDDLTGDSLISLVRDAISTALTFSKPDVPMYCCFTWRTYSEFEEAMAQIGRELKACIVWDKKSIGLGMADYRPQHEFIFYSSGKWYGDKSQSDVWALSRGSTGDYVHPTQKPVELIERALNNSSKAGDIVIDCFGGSGSTLIACEKQSRHARLIELDPKYCDVIVKRWMDFTGQQAFNAETGEAFNA